MNYSITLERVYYDETKGMDMSTKKTFDMDDVVSFEDDVRVPDDRSIIITHFETFMTNLSWKQFDILYREYESKKEKQNQTIRIEHERN